MALQHRLHSMLWMMLQASGDPRMAQILTMDFRLDLRRHAGDGHSGGMAMVLLILVPLRSALADDSCRWWCCTR